MKSFGMKCEPQVVHFVVLEKDDAGVVSVVDSSRFRLTPSLPWPSRLNGAMTWVKDSVTQVSPDVLGLRVVEHQSLRNGNIQSGTVERFHLEGVVQAAVASLGKTIVSCNTQQFRAATGASATIADYTKGADMLDVQGFAGLTVHGKEAAAAALYAFAQGS